MRNDTGYPVRTITDLKNLYKDGVPFSSKYRLELSFPQKISSLAPSMSDTLDIACQSAEIPKETIKTQTVWYRGRPLNLKGQMTYDTSFKITVQDTGHFLVRKALERWMDLCDTIKSSEQSNEDYKIDEVYLYHLDTYGKPTLKTTFYGVFLNELGSISLSDKDTSAISYDCSFTYSTFITEVL